MGSLKLFVFWFALVIETTTGRQKLRCPLTWTRVSTGAAILAEEDAIFSVTGTHIVIRELNPNTNVYMAGWAQKLDNDTCKYSNVTWQLA